MGKTRRTGDLVTDNNLYVNPTDDSFHVGTGITMYGGSVGIISCTGLYIGGSSVSAAGGGGLSNISEDTTPTLGGTLETNGNLVQFGDSGSATDDRLQFGASQDLQIYHNGTANIIHSTVSGANLQLRQTGTGSVVVYGDSPRLDFNDVTGGTQIDFRLQANNGDFVISDITNSDNVFKYDQNAGVQLYYDGATKFETTSTGVSVAGHITLNNTGANIIGICTATSFDGDGANITGISTNNITDYGVGLGGGGGGVTTGKAIAMAMVFG